MFFQTVIQTLLGKRKKVAKDAQPTSEKELSPMAQSIMQKLAEHEKNTTLNSKASHSPENKGDK
jgi:hypothetical protein